MAKNKGNKNQQKKKKQKEALKAVKPKLGFNLKASNRLGVQTGRVTTTKPNHSNVPKSIADTSGEGKAPYDKTYTLYDEIPNVEAVTCNLGDIIIKAKETTPQGNIGKPSALEVQDSLVDIKEVDICVIDHTEEIIKGLAKVGMDITKDIIVVHDNIPLGGRKFNGALEAIREGQVYYDMGDNKMLVVPIDKLQWLTKTEIENLLKEIAEKIVEEEDKKETGGNEGMNKDKEVEKGIKISGEQGTGLGTSLLDLILAEIAKHEGIKIGGVQGTGRGTTLLDNIGANLARAKQEGLKALPMLSELGSLVGLAGDLVAVTPKEHLRVHSGLGCGMHHPLPKFQNCCTESHAEPTEQKVEQFPISKDTLYEEGVGMERMSTLQLMTAHLTAKTGYTTVEHLYSVGRRTIDNIQATTVEGMLEEISAILEEDYNYTLGDNYELFEEWGIEGEYSLVRNVYIDEKTTKYCKTQHTLTELEYQDYVLLRVMMKLCLDNITEDEDYEEELLFFLGGTVNTIKLMGLGHTIQQDNYTKVELISYLKELLK